MGQKWERRKQKLQAAFSPGSIAVIGASDSFEKLGFHVMRSLIEGGYKGTVYPVNARAFSVWGA